MLSTHRGLTVLFAAAVLGLTASLSAEPPQWRNRVDNASFEAVDTSGIPSGWAWAPGKTQAQVSVDRTVARSGNSSLKIVNPTPLAPNVFARLSRRCAAMPNTDYTLSCYVKSAVVGKIWIGGGRNWEFRFPFPAAAPEWTRVVGTFRTESGEQGEWFTITILCEDVTGGVWIDDVMLEPGTLATDFVFDTPLPAGDTVLEVRPYALGENLLGNSSFETVDGNRPRGWLFDARNTDAALKIDQAVTHSGQSSLLFTNGTPFGPHVYAALFATAGVSVKPSTSYTFSAYVRSAGPANAWFGGGKDWRVRCHVPGTGGEWRRVSRSFVTQPDETSMPVLIVTEAPTAGFWIDDVKLEEGPLVTPYLPEGQAQAATVEWQLRPLKPTETRHGALNGWWNPTRYPPDSTVFLAGGFWLDGTLTVPDGVEATGVSCRLLDGDGKELVKREAPCGIRKGVGLISFGCGRRDLDAAKLTAECVVTGPGGARLAAGQVSLSCIVPAQFEAKLKRVDELLAELRARIEQLKPRGLESRALATTTVLENFTAWAREDAERGEFGRAYDAAVDMVELGERRLVEADTVLAGTHPGFAAWRYATGPIRIDGPAFVADSVNSTDGRREQRPVFFCGYGHFGAVRRDIEKFPAYGANMIQIEFGPSSVLTAEDQYSDKTIDDFLKVCDRAAAVGVTINLLLSPHYFPGWAFQKWPHLANASGGFLKYDINAPEARMVIEKSLRYVIPRIKDHPAIHSLCMSNEPVFADMEKSEFCAKLWRDWLQRRYGEIGRLNAVWGTAFASFDAVPVEKDFTDTAATYDFVCFNQEQFAGWHRWMADIIHEMAPAMPVHAKIMMMAHWYRNNHGIWSVDPELFGDLSQIHGNDCCKWYVQPAAGDVADPKAWANGWVGENMGYDFQRAMGDKPVFDSENHFILDRYVDFVPAEHLYNVMWQGAVHGMSASTSWVWERTFEVSHDFTGSIMHRPACTEAQNLACLDLNRLSREVTALQRVKPHIVLLSSLASNLYDKDYVRALQEAYVAFLMAGVPVGFVTERQLERWNQGGEVPYPLQGAKLLVLPGVTRISDATLAGVAKLATAGGTVLRIGTCFTHDEHNRSRQAAATVPGTVWDPAKPQDLWPRCRALLKELGIAPPVELVDATGNPVWGVEMLTTELDGKLLVNLANYLRIPQTQVRLVAGGRDVAGQDLTNLRPLSGPFTLAPLMPMLAAVDAGQ
ncbi:MAG: hypothetical protein A3K19_31515 [Lentisphaerae bacterium RIFOXYB12_FULL_65_16]|nr:MAG: hypothetical protein A3K18_34380 [Lentisphaerae bacterium RIFOXYA12_64_32]OGV88573.1 MAG: hypothetical protein A3K19_31515 [Lentisphaerae bacterium RIFOXYB12_FULL_65_16]